MKKIVTKTAKNVRLSLDLLNQALRVEYSMIHHYPRLASLIEDEEIKQLVLKLGHVSINHADIVASMIRELGGDVDWSFEFAPLETDLIKIFQTQLEREHLAFELHQQNVDLSHDSSAKEKFRKLVKDETDHIRTVESILSRLKEHISSS